MNCKISYPSHRTPSYQPDQLIEQRLHKKQYGAQQNTPIPIHVLLSLYLLHYTCTNKLVMWKMMQMISIKIASSFSMIRLVGQNVVRWECAAPTEFTWVLIVKQFEWVFELFLHHNKLSIDVTLYWFKCVAKITYCSITSKFLKRWPQENIKIDK